VRRLVVAAVALGAVGLNFAGNPTEYFAYFTILTNLSIGLWFLWAAAFPARGEAASTLRFALTIYGLATFSVYWIFLSPIHHPQGWQFVINLFLHLGVPLAMAFEDVWVPWPPVGPWTPLQLLGVPAVYWLVAVVRGELTGWYPYFFVNRTELGSWTLLVAYLIGLMVAFALLGYGWRWFVHARNATAK